MAKHINSSDNIQAPKTSENAPEDAVLAAIGVETAPAAQAPAAAEKKTRKAKAVVALEKSDGPPSLSEDEMARLEEEAREEVEKELKADLAREYKENFKLNLKRKALFKDATDEEGDGMVTILIDLPPFCPDIRLDGVRYFPGQTYTVGQAKAATLREVMARTYRHDDETSGADANRLAYRRQRRDRTSANNIQSYVNQRRAQQGV